MINKFFTDLIGPSWRTTIYGVTSKVFLGFLLAVVVQPTLIDNTFGNYATGVKSWCLLIWFILGTMKDHLTADKASIPGIAKDQAQMSPPSVIVMFLAIGSMLFMTTACTTTQEAAFSDWFTNPKTQTALKAVASVAEQVGLQYARSHGIIDQADADNIAGIISSARQLESTPAAADPAAIRQTIIDNSSGVNAQALADAFARGYAIAKSKAPDAPATAILEAAAQAFPVGVDKAVAINNANP